MKRITLLLTVLALLASVSCAPVKTPQEPSPTVSVAPSIEPSPEPAPNGVYDPEYDYSANPAFRVTYYTLSAGALYDVYSQCFAAWSRLMNIDYGRPEHANGDKDIYYDNLTLLAEENDGLLLDTMPDDYMRCAELLDELGCHWMPTNSPAYNLREDGYPYLHPYCCEDNAEIGAAAPAKLLEIKNELWSDIDISEFCFLAVDWFVAPQTHQRTMSCKDALFAIDPGWEDRWLEVDVSNTHDYQYTIGSALMQAPNYDRFLVFAVAPSIAQYAGDTLAEFGLADSSAIVTYSTDLTGDHWDFQKCDAVEKWSAGEDSIIKAIYWLPAVSYTEPMLGGLYLLMLGQETPETLWSELSPAETAGYAVRNYNNIWVDRSNFRQALEWSDIYAGVDFYPGLPSEGINRDTFSATVR